MNNAEQINAHSAVPAEPALFTPDVMMVVLTWATFFLLLGVLYKFAWKPILAALNEREELIRRSVDNADKLKEELSLIQGTRHQVLKEAQESAREIISEAKKSASQISQVIQNKAKEETSILLDNARRDIREETQKARIILREESAQIAIDLAGKLIEKNLDTESNRKLISKLTAEV